jgi:outer membrane receptor protein involved in Fe transport
VRALVLALCFVTSVSPADGGPTASYAGRTLVEVIDEFRSQGEPFVYSTNVVSNDLFVAFEPEPGTPLEIVRQILRPHGLTVQTDSDVHIIVREPARPAQETVPDSRHAAPARPEIETVIVAASRYEISRDLSPSRFQLDQRSIQNMPDIGEDPIRLTQRLPGAAASGASARTHFRGGEQNEVGIMLNGQWLFDPFHIRDYQNVFSAIDARAIDGVEVYTGGFPVRYGDRMSGLVIMESLEPETPRHNEIGISVFNTSVLTAGTGEGHAWLFSARRGNLDLVIDPKFGRPSYFDIFAEYAVEFSPAARLSINALYADDNVELVLETDPEEREQVESDTRNAQFWLHLQSDWSDNLSSNTVLALVDYSNRRNGETNDVEKMVARVSDDRDIRQLSLLQDWLWAPSDSHRTQWGLQVTYSDADFRYEAEALYGGLQAVILAPVSAAARSLQAGPSGASYAVYVSDRWKTSDRVLIEWGMRWDDQTYTNLESDSQLSPRLNLLYRTSEKTELRLSAGRFQQSQPVQSLQIEDGVTRYWPAQRADHIIVGFRYLAPADTALRVEAFYKDISKIRPRFENLHDPLGILPELQADRVRIAPTRARAQGVEISADRIAGAWNWWSSYTWSKVSDRVDGRDVPRSWDQRHALQAGIGWHDERWSFSAAASVHTGWPTTSLRLVETGTNADGEPVYEAVAGPRNAERLPVFASLDARISRSFDVRRGTMMVFAEVSNLLNRRNVCCIDWDIGDSGLESSRDYWMPLLPAIGILWEF